MQIPTAVGKEEPMRTAICREYLPKRQKIGRLSQAELDDIADELNHRPRKRHGFRTPIEM